MPSIAGRYQMYKAEDMEPHLAAFGLSYLFRKMASVASPSLEIIIEGDKVTIRNITPIKTSEIVFTLGQEYEESFPDGSKMKSVTKILNDHEMVTESVVPSKGMKTIRHHVFTDDGCTITTTTDVVEKPGVRYFKRTN